MTNVSVNTDLLVKARALKINLSATLEAALAEGVAQSRRERWQHENVPAIAAYNDLVEEQGRSGDTVRQF